MKLYHHHFAVAQLELLPRDEKLRAEVTRWRCREVAHFVRRTGTGAIASSRGRAPHRSRFCVASMLMYAEESQLPLNGLTTLARWLATVEKQRGWQRSRPPAQ